MSGLEQLRTGMLAAIDHPSDRNRTPPYRVASPPTSLTGPTISWPGSTAVTEPPRVGTENKAHAAPPSPTSATTQPSGSAAGFLLLQHLFHRIHGREEFAANGDLAAVVQFLANFNSPERKKKAGNCRGELSQVRVLADFWPLKSNSPMKRYRL